MSMDHIASGMAPAEGSDGWSGREAARRPSTPAGRCRGRPRLGLAAAAAVLALWSPMAAALPLSSTACPEPEAAAEAGITCGTLEVPASWDRPQEGSPFTTYVVRVPSLAEDPAPDPVVFLAGGPGYGSARLWRSALTHPLWRALRARRDLILIDERGTGRATPQVCPAQNDALRKLPSQGLDLSARRAETRRLLADCAAELARDGLGFANFRSRFVARDLAALRSALGLDAWNLLGLSYGARQVTAALREDPGGVRAAVLASPSMPNAPFFSSGVAFDESLAAVMAMCAAEARCAAEFPDLDRRLPAMLAALDREPLVADGLDPAVHAEGRLALTGELAAQAIGLMLYGRELSAAMPAAVRAMERRDADVLRSMAGALAGARAGNQMLVLGLPCIEADPFDDPAAIADDRARAGVVGRAVMNGNTNACDVLGPPQPDPADATADPHGVPLLALVGAFDPITPPERMRPAVAALPQSRFVELAAESHQFLGSRDTDCGRRLALAFLDDPGAPLDTTCAAAIPSLNFVTGLHPTGKPAARIAAVARQPAALIALGAALLLLASAPLGAAVAAWRDRQAPVRATASNALLFATGAGALGFLGLLAAAVVPWVRDQPLALGFGVPAWISPWFAAAWVIAACGLAATTAGALAWRRGLHATGSIVYRTLVGLSALGVGVFAGTMGLP